MPLYLTEMFSPRARALVERQNGPLTLNSLQELEFRNTIRQKVFRGEIEESIAIRCLRIFDDDCVLGKIVRKPVYWDPVYAKAEQISISFAMRGNCRAFDLLRVAVAVLSNGRRFATFDRGQAELARAAGLTLADFE